jgi:hydrophobic/amphiphilic exporter-1 (mainly G- bacteria), HAE1 family
MTRWFLAHPVAAWVLFAALLILGAYALPRLQIESMPEVELPGLTIQTSWTGASPVAVQRAITVPVEEAVRRVHGVEKVVARSYPGLSQVEVSFRREVNVEYARLELGEQLGAVRRDLPLSARPPEIRGDVPEQFRVQDFFTLSLISSLEPNRLREEAEKWIVPQVAAMEGVAGAEIQGGADPLLRIILDREKLRILNLGAESVLQAVLTADDVRAGGVVRQGASEALVSIRDETTRRDLERLVVARLGERLIRLGEIAEVRPDHEDPTYFVRVNGENLVRLSVEKRRGANAVTVSRRLRALLPLLQKGLPFPVTLEVDQDQGGEMEKKLQDLAWRSLAILGLLILLLLPTVRNARLVLIIIGSILYAIVISLSLFYFFGLSINFITISGLTICFGMILDNSILVLDGAHLAVSAAAGGLRGRWRERLAPGRALRAIADGTEEVAFPILGTTLTTIIPFLSFVFLSGRLSLYYAPLAVAVTASLGASIFVALGWTPVALRTLWLHARGAGEIGEPAPAPPAAPPPPRRPGRFERFVGVTLRAWPLVVAVAVLSMAAAAWIYARKVDRGGFWGVPERETLYLAIRLPEGSDVLLTSQTMARFEGEILPVPPGVHARSQVWRNQGQLTVEFDGRTLYSELPLLYRARLIEMAEKMAGMGIYLNGFSDQSYVKGFFGMTSLNSTLKLTGYNSRTLDAIAERALKQIQRNRRVRQARALNDLRGVYTAQNESIVTLRRDQLSAYGLDAAEVVAFLRRLVGLDYPWTMVVDGESERIQLSYDDADRIEFEQLANQILRTRSGREVRLGDILTLETVPLAGTVVREDQRYAKYVTWEFVGTEAMRTRFLSQVLEGLKLPYGYTAEETQQTFLSEEERSELGVMLGLAVVFIYMILAALFESFGLPLLVLLAVPLSLVGVFAVFWASGSTFDSSARIGLVLLFGVVVNNAILLLARYRHEVRAMAGGQDLRGTPEPARSAILREAICRGTQVRLRSVLLTTGTTIAGMLPLLVHFKRMEGKDIWENLALSSIGGLTAGTILILLVFPAAYYVAARAGWRWREPRAGRTRPPLVLPA